MEYEKRVEQLRELDSFALIYRAIRGDRSVYKELVCRFGYFAGRSIVSAGVKLPDGVYKTVLGSKS